jgi:hypothetical protein
MEINNHTKFNEFLNNSPRQNIFQIKSNVGAEPLYFLQELYTSPPKINIAWKELETMGLSHPPNKHQLVSSKIPSQSIGNRINRNRSIRVFNRFTVDIKNALRNIPVYVLVNGRNELVVATTKSIKYPDSDLLTKSKEQKFGFIFFDKREADLYLAQTIQKLDATMYTERTTGLAEIGLSVHCIGLDYAYNLFRNSNSVDFRFVPSLNQINYFLENFHESDRSTFSLGQETVNQLGRSFPLDNLTKNLMLPSLGRLNSGYYFKGVPIYVVQLKDVPYAMVQEAMLQVTGLNGAHSENTVSVHTSTINVAEKVAPSIVDYYRDFISQNFPRSTTFSSSIHSTPNSNKLNEKTANYVFFDKMQAEQFSLKCRPYLLKDTNFSNQGVQISSLEQFLEICEDTIILKKDFDTANIKFTSNSEGSTHFIPTKESLEVLKDYSEQPKKSLDKSIKIWLKGKFVKLRRLQHDYLGLILRGYKL